MVANEFTILYVGSRMAKISEREKDTYANSDFAMVGLSGDCNMSGRQFWKGETHAIVKAMFVKGHNKGIVVHWKNQVASWAKNNPTDPNAVAAKAWLPLWQVRPFYTADELAPLWPALAIAVGHTDRWPQILKSARRLEYELDFAGLPRLSQSENLRKYFIVERFDYWKKATLDQIERELNV